MNKNWFLVVLNSFLYCINLISICGDTIEEQKLQRKEKGFDFLKFGRNR